MREFKDSVTSDRKPDTAALTAATEDPFAIPEELTREREVA